MPVVIRPNDIKIEKSLSKAKVSTAVDLISDFVKVNKEHIQYVQSEQDDNLIARWMNPFVQALHISYESHVPLVLTPDTIWYCVSNGVAAHINENAEELRKVFVKHDSKEKIQISRDTFVYGSKTNPWNEIIDEFCEKLRGLTNGDIVSKFEAAFSTTTKISHVVSQIVMMDAMQKYVEYSLWTECGVPEIRLTGNKDDWVLLRAKSEALLKQVPGLEHWYQGLDEILGHFVDAFDGKIDNFFWNSIYKFSGGSGGPFVSGWVLSLFPYLDEGKKNPYCFKKSWRDIDPNARVCGLTTSSFSYHMNQVPFKWMYLRDEVDMLFIGGLVGVHVSKEDCAVQPVFAYAISEDKRNTTGEELRSLDI